MRLRDVHEHRLRTDSAYAEAVREIDAAQTQTLADQVVDARVRCHLTQAQLAAAAGLTQPQVSRLEAGLENPTVETLQRVGRALNVVLVFAAIDTSTWTHATDDLVPVDRVVAAGSLPTSDDPGANADYALAA